MSNSYDVVVIGAGIVGVACAAQLSSEGLKVQVIERGAVASGATGAAMGHIVVLDHSPAQLALTRYSQVLWHALSDELPEGVAYNRCGTLWLAANGAEMDEVWRKHALYESVGIPSTVLDGEAVTAAEPNLRSLRGALLVPEDAVLLPSAAAAFLQLSAEGNGANVLLGKTVVSAARGVATLHDGTTISAAHIVIANGVDARSLVPGLPIAPRKGHLLLTKPYPGFARHQLVELGYLQSAHSIAADSVAFNVQPRAGGKMLIGSSRQYAAQHPEVDAEILNAMLRRAEEYMPGVSQLAQERAWTGFRAATADKVPLIGPHGDDTTLLLATGHEGLGITTSLATGRLLADCIFGRESQIPREPYLSSRFALNEMRA